MADQAEIQNVGKPIFGEPEKFIGTSKKIEEQRRRNAVHPMVSNELKLHVQELPRKPVRFPDPPTSERDGRRFTTLGKGTVLYAQPNGYWGPIGEPRQIIGKVSSEAVEGIYNRRIPHPELPKAMPSIELGFEEPVMIEVNTGRGETMAREFTGVAYADRVGENWYGMEEPSTTQRLRLEKERQDL